MTEPAARPRFTLGHAIAGALGAALGASALLLTFDATADSTGDFPSRFTLAELQAITCNDSESRDARVYVVLDPKDAQDCGELDTTPGAETPHACICDGTAATWQSALPAAFPMMRINRDADQLLLEGVAQFINFDLETFDDDNWFPGVDNEHVEFDFTGRVQFTLSMRADVDPAGSPKELCVLLYINDVANGEFACFLTSDTNDTAVGFVDTFPVVPGFTISIEVLGTADLAMRATLNAERKT